MDDDITLTATQLRELTDILIPSRRQWWNLPPTPVRRSSDARRARMTPAQRFSEDLEEWNQHLRERGELP